MGEWKRVKLGSLIRIKHGYAFPGAGITSDDNGKVLVTPGNFNIGGGFKESGKKFFSGEFPAEYCLSGGDLIVTMTDLSKASDTLGYSAIVPSSSDNQYLHNQRIGLVSIVDEMADRNFIYWLMRTPSYHQEVVAGASGTTVKHTSPSRIYDVEVDLPDLPTQRRIAAVLGALDDKIEVNRKICENLEAQAQALFKSWFVDFEPFGGKRPEGWKMGKLGDVADCNPYRKLEKGVEATCVEMADLAANGSFPSGCSVRVYNGGMKFTNGDTIIARITPCFENGKAAFVNFLKEGEVAFGSTEYVVIASKSVAPSGMFYSLVKTSDFLTYAKSRMVGSSGRQRFSASDVAEYPMVIAANDAYEKLTPVYDSLMSKIAQCGRESRALAAMRDALLPKLMSGELAVEKVEVAERVTLKG